MLAKAKQNNAAATDGTSFMSDRQLADYLTDLRTNRNARLNGSRPAPLSRYESQRKTGARVPDHAEEDHSLMPGPLRLRPAPPPKEIDASQIRGNLSTSPSVIYLEDGTRQTERHEAHSLRMALEEMDLSEDQRIHEAAQAEASDLVLEHMNPGRRGKDSGYTNPDLTLRDRTVHLRQGCQSDTASNIPALSTKKSTGMLKFSRHTSDETAPPVPKKKGYHGLASAVATDIANIKRRVSSGGTRIVSGGRRKASHDKHSFPNVNDKIYEEPEIIKEEEPKRVRFAPPEIIQIQPVDETQQTDIPRHVRKNPFARVRLNKDNLERANSLASTRPSKLDSVEIQKNPPTQSRRPWYMSNKPNAMPAADNPTDDDSMKDSPKIQDLNEGREVRSDEIRAATSMKRKDRSPNLPQPTAVSDTPGRPIVSFQNDWQRVEEQRRQSQGSMREKSPRASLDASSHTTGRPIGRNASPIASHNQQSGPADSNAIRHQRQQSSPLPQTSIPNGIPILNLPDNDDGSSSRVLAEEPVMPQINLLGRNSGHAPVEARRPQSQAPVQAIPVIQLDDTCDQGPAARPLPVPTRTKGSREVAEPISTSIHRTMSKPHVTPYQKRSAVLCAQCALPISGRIVTAAGERFHPECFSCHQCGINLECVAFYPEPDKKYYERLARIQQRMQGFEIGMPEGSTEEDARRLEQADGDESMRFYCHLDFHELFSPRCKSCKTPIEGEVVVACGSEWHVGHFFCAQCGDPFDSTTPFVEKDGYAWCLGCHTNRYSPKCKKCRKPVTDIVVNALGHDWHAECFCCWECGGGFDDGQYFLRAGSTDPVCVLCEDRRLKA